jgi:hypothetical protein
LFCIEFAALRSGKITHHCPKLLDGMGTDWGRAVGIVWHAMNSLWMRVAMSFLTGAFTCPPAKAESVLESLFGFGAAASKSERVLSKRVKAQSEWHTRRPAAPGEDYS